MSNLKRVRMGMELAMWILSPQQLLLYTYCIVFCAYLYDYIWTVDAEEDEEGKMKMMIYMYCAVQNYKTTC